jgi:hypothetical protein
MSDWLDFVPFVPAVAGIFVLLWAWKQADGWRPWRLLVGWLLLAGGLTIAWHILGPVRGIFIAITGISIAALLAVATNMKVKPAKVIAGREVALEPSDRKRVVWRGWLRGFLAGPGSGIAAMGVGLMWAVCTPGAPQTRMVIGGLMVPVLWAGGMAWTLSDDKIVRAFLVLLGVSVVSLGAAFLKGTLA